ncbi:uncharacterized protein F4812DRAFT_323434 [Daldinia caldariorum]|uniref:uncharacterized protein n=1 Tax=Daldinia caldariorum TaxID=326644 RepID=UPI0020087354|nr:uncharacterized protein F4812DRAFT_323434 [Daldinia caldariorum]KAI1469246.1 hypothetical protein F4812DRAFT_323434 [Daldinia caldariorum]
MPFEFVDNAILDRRTRKLIRSQAAKGRNVGKKHPSRGRRAAIKANIAESHYNKPNDFLALQPRHAVLPTIERQVGDSLSVFSLPVESTPGSRIIIQKALAFLMSIPTMPKLGRVVDFTTAGSIWIQFWFVDEAYFHCAMAASIAAKNMLTSSSENYSEGLRHLSHSLQIVNQRLSGGKALLDTTLASVVAMLQYERMCGQYQQSLIHFRGLQRMVELRGGISQLRRDKPELAQKIFRADLEFAIYLGSPTLFGVDELPDTATIDWLRERFGASRVSALLASPLFMQLSPDMQEIWIDVMSHASFLNENENNGIKMDGYKYHDTLILIGYRLVHIRPLDKGPGISLENDIHTGLLMLMTNFFLSILHRVPDLPLLRQRIEALVLEKLIGGKEEEEVLLWILFMAGITIPGLPEDEHFMRRISEVTISLDLQSWDDVRQILSKFPWIKAIHERPGNTLWNHRTFN